MGIIFTLNQSVWHWWDNHFVILAFRQYEQCAGIVRSIRKKLICQESLYQVMCWDNVIYVVRSQLDAQSVAQGERGSDKNND